MRARYGVFGLMMLACAPASAAPPDPAGFVQLYIHQLAQMDALQPRADVKRDPLAACGAGNARIVETQRAQIAEVQGIAFGQPFESLVPNLVKTYQRKLTLYGQLQTACAAHAAAGVKDALSNIDYANRNIVSATPVVFAVLMDLRGGGSGAAARQLSITRATRERLVRRIDAAFGKKIAAKNQASDQNWTVAAAGILRDALTNPQFKAADTR
jgi:hypothetical protein